jgi:pimeloyl-ACP methyl ester carboxylesterase
MSGIAREQVRYVTARTGERLAFQYTPGRLPTVVFLSGYASDMSGSKALYLEARVRARGHGFLRLDYSGHGVSEGDFIDGCVGRWADDALTVIREATSGPLLLVGSSMGGWIMLIVARELADRVRALVGIAAAPDFTEELMWHSLDATQRDELLTRGELYLDSDYVDDPYPVTSKLIADGRDQLQLQDSISLTCPVRLIHGLEDNDVPWRTSITLAEKLDSRDVQITLVKGGGHRLAEAEQLTLIAETIEQLLDVVSESER